MFKRALNRFLETTLRKKPLKQELIGVLDDILRIYSPSGKELPVVEYSTKLLKNSGFEVIVDEFENVIASRGKYSPEDKLVCINAHTDTVQKIGDEGVQFMVFYDWIRDAFHSNNRVMIGGDDKCGVAVALTLAAYTDLPMKIVLTSGEEIGSVGAEAMDRKHFDDVEFTFTVDRMHGGDLVSEYCGLTLAPETFVKRFIAMSESIGVMYKDTHGSYADTYVLAKYAPAVNLSSGYYNPHSKNDYILVNETYNTMIAIKNAIENKNDLIYAILQAPKDWQKDTYAEMPSMGFGRYGDFGHYGGGARSRSQNYYYGLSRKERRKCKIKYGKVRGFDDKETTNRKLPNPDPDAVKSVDDLIEAYANGELYDEEWDALLFDGTLTKVEYSLGIDENIARAKYAAAFDNGKLDEDEVDFKQALDDASTMPVDFGDEYGHDELRDVFGLGSGFLLGTVEDDIYIEYINGQLTFQELSEYLREGSITRYFFDRCSRDKQDFILKTLPTKPTRISHTASGRTIYEYGTKTTIVVLDPRDQQRTMRGSAKRDQLASHGFVSGYKAGSMEDDIFVEFMIGNMTQFELWEKVREGLFPDTAREFIKIKRAYQDDLEIEDFQKFEKEHEFLYNKQRGTTVLNKSKKYSRDSEKTWVRGDEYDDSTDCRGN